MKWFDKIKSGFKHFFQRCYGADNLGMCIVTASLVCLLLDRFIRSGLLTIIGLGLYIWAVFRMLSRNTVKRAAENRKFTQWWLKAKTETRQFFNRLKNSRKYKYYRCPQCKARLRMPRGIGEKTVTCSQCRHTFTKKA